MDISALSATTSPPSEVQADQMSTTDESDVMKMMQTRRTRRRIPNDQWEAKRALITRLYQKDKKSLKEVMEILDREHDFRATVKMFKSRIWKWGLDKKLKEDEVLAILQLKRERDTQQKRSQFTIRGQMVDLDNINRYIKRKPVLLARFRAGEVPNAQTALEVSCYTPPPSPTLSMVPLRGEMNRVDEVLHLFRNYIDGSFLNLSWDWEYDVSCGGRMPGDRSEELFERVLASFALVNRCMKQGDNISLNDVLSPAFESLKELVLAESPVFIVRTVCLLWYLAGHWKKYLLRYTMDYLGDLVPIVLGQQHVLSRIWRIFKDTQFSDYYELSMCLYALVVPILEERIGPANELTTLVYGDHIDCVFYRQRTTESLALVTRYRAKVEATGQTHPWLTEFAITQTALLCNKKVSDGLIGEAIDCLHQLKHYPMHEEQEALVEMQMGNYNYELGNHRSAISSYRQATRLAMTGGSDERLVLTCLTNLETALSKAGWLFEANRVQHYRLARIAEFAAETSSLAKQQLVTAERGFASSNSVPALPDYSGHFDTGFMQQDVSWLWQDNNSASLLRAVSPLTAVTAAAAATATEPDQSLRWLGIPVASDAWTGSMSVSPAPVASSHYPSLSPLIPDTADAVAWQPDVFP